MSKLEQVERILAADTLKFPLYPKLVRELVKEGFMVDRYDDDLIVLTDCVGAFGCRLRSASSSGRTFSSLDSRPELRVRLEPLTIMTSLGDVLPQDKYTAICWAIARAFPDCHRSIKLIGLSRLPAGSSRVH